MPSFCAYDRSSNSYTYSLLPTSTLLYILFLFTLASNGIGGTCQQAGRLTICEIPEDIPPPPLERGLDQDFFSYNPSKQKSSTETELGRVGGRQASSVKSDFSATIIGSPSQAHTDAINFCMDRAADNWVSNITVDVKVTISNLGDSFVLGQAQPTRSWGVREFICPVALAEAAGGRELNSRFSGDARFDILMSLNSGTNWYLGLDARPPRGQFDLVTVCLHEIYHGLFMSGGNIGVSYSPVDLSYSGIIISDIGVGRFDAFMANQDGCNITGYKDNPLKMGSVLTGNNLWFVSESERIARLHAPRPYVSGSSLYHLSETEYGSRGDENGLMTPAIGSAYSQHNLGPIMTQIQAMVLDIARNRGARSCDPITDPLVDNTAIDQTTGDNSNSNGANEESGGGFVINIGGNEISGWIVVGAAVGAVLGLAVVVLTVRSVIVSKRKAADVQRKRPRRRVDGNNAFVNGGNGGGIV